MVIGDDHDPRVRRQDGLQGVCAALAQAATGGVVGARRQQHGAGAAGNGGLQCLGQRTRFIHGHAQGLHARQTQSADAAQKAGVFHRHLVARHQLRRCQALDCIDGAMGQLDAVLGGAVSPDPFFGQLHQTGQNRLLAIEKGARGIACQQLDRIGQPARAGVAAGEIDQGRFQAGALLLPGGGRVGNAGAQPALGHRKPGLHQPLVGRGHGVAVHVQRLGQVAHRRQAVARRQVPIPHQAANAVGDLEYCFSSDFHIVLRQKYVSFRQYKRAHREPSNKMHL